MDLARARAIREAAIARRGAPPPPRYVRPPQGVLWAPTPRPDEVGLLAMSGVVAMTKIWSGAPLQLDQSWDATQPPTDAPVNTSPPIIQPVGGFSVGEVVVGTVGSWTLNPSFSRQWLRGSQPIYGATANTYTLGPLDVGQMLGLIVFATSSEGAVGSPSAAPVGPILAA